MVNILNKTFDDYVNFIATNRSGGKAPFSGSVITYNINKIANDAKQSAAARLAFSVWSEVTGLTFQQTSGTANIQISNDQKRHADTGGSDPADIVISRNWPGAGGWKAGSYGFQTFLHEIGHALGLGHGGNYNVNGTYSKDKGADIDTWQFSVMSYFSQSNYGKASPLNLFSPMLADIEAIIKLYGKLAVHAGDTVYGGTSGVMQGLTNFKKFGKAAFSIHDTGGFDTLDLTTCKKASTVDLQPGSYSNLNGYVGNLGIAKDTVIERVNGSKVTDIIHGNDANNQLYGNDDNDQLFGMGGNDFISGGLGRDWLSGGAGHDSFVFDTKLGSKNVDTIADFEPGVDLIDLDQHIFTKIATGHLAPGAFEANTSGVASNPLVRIVYDKDDGILYYDRDGNGFIPGVKFAFIGKNLDVTYKDFLVI